MQEIIYTAIVGGIKEKIEEAYDELKIKLLERLEKDRMETIAGVLLRITKNSDFQVFSDRIVFTINEIKQ